MYFLGKCLHKVILDILEEDKNSYLFYSLLILPILKISTGCIHSHLCSHEDAVVHIHSPLGYTLETNAFPFLNAKKKNSAQSARFSSTSLDHSKCMH